jgi:hypothetical protein
LYDVIVLPKTCGVKQLLVFLEKIGYHEKAGRRDE